MRAQHVHRSISAHLRSPGKPGPCTYLPAACSLTRPLGTFTPFARPKPVDQGTSFYCDLYRNNAIPPGTMSTAYAAKGIDPPWLPPSRLPLDTNDSMIRCVRFLRCMLDPCHYALRLDFLPRSSIALFRFFDSLLCATTNKRQMLENNLYLLSSSFFLFFFFFALEMARI